MGTRIKVGRNEPYYYIKRKVNRRGINYYKDKEFRLEGLKVTTYSSIKYLYKSL